MLWRVASLKVMGEVSCILVLFPWTLIYCGARCLVDCAFAVHKFYSGRSVLAFV